MTKTLFLNAVTKFLTGLILTGLLIFVPAGTYKFINGWILLATLFLPIFVAGIIMMLKAPELLMNRLELNETRTRQKIVISMSGVLFAISFVLAGLNFRYNWCVISNKIVTMAVTTSILAYIIFGIVLYQNKHLSRTIKLSENQKIITTGLYGIIRHPMYLASTILFLSLPLVLGSLYSFLLFLIYPVLIVIRILDEEKFLESNSNEYAQYKLKVKYRLLPFIW